MTERLLQPGVWSPDNWPALAVALGVPLAKAAILILLTAFAARLARSSFVFATERTGADAHIRLIVGRTVSIVVVILGAITILDTLGVPPTTLVTFIGVVGIGISLALQDILKNFFAGTYLLFERPFRIGDEISVKDQRGIVENIGVRTTRLRTEQNVLVAIPNAVMFSEMVLNRTNERKSVERVAADNERAVQPSTGAMQTNGATPAAVAATTAAGVNGSTRGAASEPLGRAPSVAGALASALFGSPAIVDRLSPWGMTARSYAASALTAARSARLPVRLATERGASRVAAWLPRLRFRD